MEERTKQEQDVVSNLVDAGCDNELIDQFIDLLKNGKKKRDYPCLQNTAAFYWTVTMRTRKRSTVWTT